MLFKVKVLAYSVEHLRTLGLFCRTAASFKHLNSRRKLCEPYSFRSLVTKFFKIGELWDGVGGVTGVSKNVGHHGWSMWKNCQIALAKKTKKW